MLQNFITVSFAANVLIGIFGLLFIFHLLVMVGIIPYSIVWAGKIKNQKEMLKMETVSLIILTFSTIMIAQAMGYIQYPVHFLLVKVGTWILAIFFFFNTIGNLTAKNPIEKYGFGLLTAIIALLIVRIAIVL